MEKVTSFGRINYRDEIVVVRRRWSNTQRMLSVYLRDGEEMEPEGQSYKPQASWRKRVFF